MRGLARRVSGRNEGETDGLRTGLRYMSGLKLLEHQCMLAGRDLFFPSLDFRLPCGRHRRHNAVNESPNLG